MAGKLAELTNDLLEGREYQTFFESFDRLPARQSFTYVVADQSAGGDIAATIVMAPASPILIHDALIMPDGTAADIDDSNTSVWTVLNGTTALVAATYDATNTHPADNVQVSLGTIDTANVVQGGGRVEFSLTNGVTADTVRTLLTIVYSDLNAFPRPGWKVVSSDHGQPTMSDGSPPAMSLAASDATAGDNDEIYLVKTVESLKFVAGRPIELEALVQFSEANTDDANIAFGMMDAVAADSIADNGAGLKSTGSMAAIYKVDGGTVWRCRSMGGTGGTNSDSVSVVTAGGSSYQRLRISVVPFASNNIEVSYFVDGVPLVDSTGAQIKHRILSLSGDGEMQLFFGCKNGGTNKETLLVQYAYGNQRRAA